MSMLCLGCMEQIEEDADICPICGYQKDAKAEAEFALKPGILIYKKYLIGKVIGMGGFGITYLGWDQDLKRKVAVKEYFPSEFATRNSGERKLSVYPGDTKRLFYKGLESFLEEGKHLAKFVCVPQIVTVYDCFLENETGYLVMEYLTGKTMKQLLKEEKQIPVETALHVADEVLAALERIHAEDMLHRDVAPDNIMITDGREVKLLDFGSARNLADAGNKSLSIMLKPGYAPEEQYRVQGEQGPWTDVYGMGATLYRMVTGKRPQSAVERLLKEELIPVSQCGVPIKKGAAQAIMRSLGVKKEERFHTAREFRMALKEDGERQKAANIWLPLGLTALAAVLAVLQLLI